MNKVEKLIAKICPNGVEFVPLWTVTTWDKKFNAVERSKQPQIISYPYLLAADLFSLEQDEGDVFLLSTGEQTGWTTEELAGENLREGEVVTIPWGKSRPVKEVIKYYRGRFVTADNRIATSNDTDKLLNKFLYYWMISQGKVIDTFYRGSGIKHPNMAAVLDMSIPIPPVAIQQEIVKILDNFTELEAELEARKKQYEYYRTELLTFNERERVRWIKIAEICKISRGRVMSKEYLHTNAGPYPVYSSQTADDGVFGYINSYDYDGEYITWTTDGANAGSIFYRNGKFSITNVCGLLKVRVSDVNAKFLSYILATVAKKYVSSGMGNPKLMSNVMENVKVQIPLMIEQNRIVSILDKFDALVSDIRVGLPAEISARKSQYEYYRGKLLTFQPVR